MTTAPTLAYSAVDTSDLFPHISGHIWYGFSDQTEKWEAWKSYME